jgi:HEAT repeat protein
MTRADRLRRGSLEDRIAALQEIAASPPPTPGELDAVIECLGDERKAVQRHAAEAASQCARIDSSVVDRLDAVVRTGQWQQRWGAVFALSLFGSVQTSALPTLLEALDRDDGDVRWAAAQLVKELGQRDASMVTAALLEAAREGHMNQRKMSLYILRDLGLQSGSGVALDALHAEAIEVRLAALAALVALAPDKAVAAGHVVALVNDEDARMRRVAAAALGRLEVTTDAIISALEAASKTDDAGLRRAADGALRVLAAHRAGS